LEELVRLDSVTKRFGGVTALDQVTFSVLRGEVHAVVGGNGAGKSSLMSLLAGIEQPSAGSMWLSGQPFRPSGPSAARHAGISMVFQELNLFPHRSITENLFLDRELCWGPFLRRSRMRELARASLERVGLAADPDALVSSLSMSERQLVEIARALQGRSELVILDEPNSALTDQESIRLFDLMRKLTAEGVTVLFVSQRLEDVLKVSDRISVLRDGRYQGTLVTRETEPGAVIAKMLGRSEEAPPLARPEIPESATMALQTRGLRARGFGPVDLSVHAGEIVGVVGLEGSGVRRLFQLVFGLERADAGSIEYQGVPLHLKSPADAIRAGAALIPPSRRDDGLMLDVSLEKNVALLLLDKLRTRFGLIDSHATQQTAQAVIEKLGVVAEGPQVPVGRLSGGNQQKVLLGRWLATEPRLLLLDDPTRGVDVGAKLEIHRLCDTLARQGLGILFSSSELEETLALADRMLVLWRGRVVHSFARGEATKALLLQAMSGAFEA
jgi:ribose transport system ATP-binding protein